MLRQLVPVVGISPQSWLTVPATLLMVWVYYDVLLLRQIKEGKPCKRITTGSSRRGDLLAELRGSVRARPGSTGALDL